MAIGKRTSIFKRIVKLDLLQELFLAAVGCCFVIILFHLFPDSFHLEAKSRNFKGKIVFSSLILAFLLLFLVLNQPNSRINFFKTNNKRNIIIFSIFFFAIQYFLYFNTSYIQYGLDGDNYYRTAYVNHMANSGYPHDYCYKNLSSYYFPFYYYCLALYAMVFQIEPYKMLLYGFLFSCYFFPIILFESWKKIYDSKKSLIITILTILLLTDSYKMSHVIVFTLLVPYILYYYENFTNKSFKLKDYIISGFLGSMLFCTYATYFYIIPIYLGIKLIQNKEEFKKNFKHLIILSIAILLFSSWYLVPLIGDFILIGIEVHQNNYLTIQMLELPIIKDILPITFLGILMFLGFTYILKKYSNSYDFKIYGNLLLSLFILVLIGFIAVLIDSPFYLYYRFFEFLIYILIISASLFFLNFFNFLKKINLGKINNTILRISHLEINILIIIIISHTYYSGRELMSNPHYKNAFEEEVPKKDIEIFEELDYEDKVFLTYKKEVACYLPIYLFICPYPHFSHPSAMHNQRLKFLIELTECKSSKEFYNEIMDCEFGPIDYFYLKLKENSTNFEFSATYDEFLDEQVVDLTFKALLFENEKYFKQIIIRGEIIYKTKY